MYVGNVGQSHGVTIAKADWLVGEVFGLYCITNYNFLQ